MARALKKILKSYVITLKNDEEIEISFDGGELLKKILTDKNHPDFVQINDGLYNHFYIKSLVPKRQEISPEREEGLIERERMERIRKEREDALSDMPF